MWFRKKETKHSSGDNTELFVGNLPLGVGVVELCALLNRFGEHFSARMLIKNFENGETCRFCIASFDSQRLARKAAKKLRKTKRGASPLEVHEYMHRTYSNERRDLHWREQAWDNEDRRGHERRRQEHVEPVDDLFTAASPEESVANEKSIKITAYRNMARKG
jgi:RNA recognition motif-containing protein